MAQPERLQKVLARAGIASRRHAEDLIVAGRVRVNGRVVTELGVRVDPRRDKVEVDGRRVVSEHLVYAVMNKPRGVVTTMADPEGRPTIAEMLKPLGVRVFPVGRLDFHTSGAILVTNDGTLSQALLHPRQHVPKVYVAKVRGVPSDAQLDSLRKGVVLAPTESDPDEKPTKTLPAEVALLRQAPPGEDSVTGAGATWLQITLHEGRTRQIHRMCDAVGLFVMRLVRMAFAGISTEGLRPGQFRELSDKELTALRVRYLRALEEGRFGDPLADPMPPEEKPARRGVPSKVQEERPEVRGAVFIRESPDKPRRRAPVDRDRPAPARTDDRRPPARTDDRRPPARTDDRRPPARTDDRRPPARTDDRRPPARTDDRRPPVRTDDRPSARAPRVEGVGRATRSPDTSTEKKGPRKRS